MLKTILLENHGIIALGAHPSEVVAALAMAEKAARIFVGAAGLGGSVFVDEVEVYRIAGGPMSITGSACCCSVGQILRKSEALES